MTILHHFFFILSKVLEEIKKSFLGFTNSYMLDSLKVLNLQAGTRLKETERGDVFILKTCQRTLVLGFHMAPLYRLQENNENTSEFETYHGEDAYQFLLETISGLKSQVLGEYEIVGQFKKAYQEYLQLPFKQNQIIQIMEKLFKDSKEIRTKFLMEIGQLSYAGIARKLLHRDLNLNSTQETSETPILITGTGELAEDLIKLLKKKNRLIVSGRNTDRLHQLKELYDVEILSWEKQNEFFHYPYIVNTIGTETILFNNDFFISWVNAHSIAKNNQRLFIDLGSPSALDVPTHLGNHSELGLLKLEDIFKESAKLTHEKMEKIQKAQAHIRSIVQKRRHTFMLTHARVWEGFGLESAL